MKPIIFLFILLFSFSVNAEKQTDIYTNAVSNSARSEADQELDAKRKPAEVLRFFEIKPGMKVFDVFAGGGYYSEIISYLVGDEGAVQLYNNAPWDRFVAKAVEKRLANDRLPNVTRMVAEPESLIELTAEFDAGIFILGMHDLYYADDENGWPLIDRSNFMSGIFSLLKDGAVFGVIDANAVSGADNAKIGKELHRVDPQVAIDDILAAGFVLEAQSDILANPKDDKTTSVFLPENRYNTDRSVLKFRKPEK